MRRSRVWHPGESGLASEVELRQIVITGILQFAHRRAVAPVESVNNGIKTNCRPCAVFGLELCKLNKRNFSRKKTGAVNPKPDLFFRRSAAQFGKF